MGFGLNRSTSVGDQFRPSDEIVGDRVDRELEADADGAAQHGLGDGAPQPKASSMRVVLGFLALAFAIEPRRGSVVEAALRCSASARENRPRRYA